MKPIVLFLLFIYCTNNTFAANSGRLSRHVVGLSGEQAPKKNDTVRIASDSATNYEPSPQNTEVDIQPNTVSTNTQPEIQPVDPELELVNKHRDICLSNNIGIGNTFVWAARNSNLDNYAQMTEDTKNPKNNACFVKVNINSTDARIDISDIKSKYVEMGRSIVCGSWVDENLLKTKILDAKKSGRTWATIGGAVGGAGIGVGAMELFGNKLIGGKVMGQKALEGQELLRSQILALEKSNKSEYNRILKALDDLESVCNDKQLWNKSEIPQDCEPSQNPFLGLRAKLK